MKIQANYYQQFDADYSLEVPAEGYGGWKKTDIDLSLDHSALVVMHAWDTGMRQQYPGWHRAVEYFQRADAIVKTVFPPLLAAVRRSKLKLYHVTSGSFYCKSYPGCQRAVALAGPTPVVEQAPSDPVLETLKAFKEARAFVGTHNLPDIGNGFKNLHFPKGAEPEGDEGVAENAHQLSALCKADGVNHLIYTGFAINWCLLMSGGGMVDMSKRGFMCSAIRQAVTAVENRESARKEWGKELALWRVAVAFGFVFDLEDVLAALCEDNMNGRP